jgi:hypothetical protein
VPGLARPASPHPTDHAGGHETTRCSCSRPRDRRSGHRGRRHPGGDRTRGLGAQPARTTARPTAAAHPTEAPPTAACARASSDGGPRPGVPRWHACPARVDQKSVVACRAKSRTGEVTPAKRVNATQTVRPTATVNGVLILASGGGLEGRRRLDDRAVSRSPRSTAINAPASRIKLAAARPAPRRTRSPSARDASPRPQLPEIRSELSRVADDRHPFVQQLAPQSRLSNRSLRP